jgi:hypothetical protein
MAVHAASPQGRSTQPHRCSCSFSGERSSWRTLLGRTDGARVVFLRSFAHSASWSRHLCVLCLLRRKILAQATDRASGVPVGPPSVGGPASPENSRVSAARPGPAGRRVSSRHGAGRDRVSPLWHAGPLRFCLLRSPRRYPFGIVRCRSYIFPSAPIPHSPPRPYACSLCRLLPAVSLPFTLTRRGGWLKKRAHDTPGW